MGIPQRNKSFLRSIKTFSRKLTSWYSISPHIITAPQKSNSKKKSVPFSLSQINWNFLKRRSFRDKWEKLSGFHSLFPSIYSRIAWDVFVPRKDSSWKMNMPYFNGFAVFTIKTARSPRFVRWNDDGKINVHMTLRDLKEAKDGRYFDEKHL